MHPVQAAPRQRRYGKILRSRGEDAPRAGSAEAKIAVEKNPPYAVRCTPCRQRRGKVFDHAVLRVVHRCTPCRQRRGKVAQKKPLHGSEKMHPVQAAPRQSQPQRFPPPCTGCTPCRQRRGKVFCEGRRSACRADAPRAGSAEAKLNTAQGLLYRRRCTPCRQRRGKAMNEDAYYDRLRCTPCRQRRGKGRGSWCCCRRRLGCTPCRQRRGKEEAERRTCNARVMHPVQAAHSEITTCRPMVL